MNAFQRQVIDSKQRQPDLEIRVSKITSDDLDYLEIREYVESLGVYGRGIIVPANFAPWLSTTISKIN